MNRFKTGATLTYATARTALDSGFAQIAASAPQQSCVVDCAPLAQFDSSALAVLLAWMRAARERAVTLSIVNLPAGLNSLARVYGVDSLIN